MNFEIDPTFRKSGARAKRRSRTRLMRRALYGLGGVCAVALLAFGIWTFIAYLMNTQGPEQQASTEADDFSLVQVDEAVSEERTKPDPSAFLDLERDPMILHFDNTRPEDTKYLPGPYNFLPTRAGPNGARRLAIVQDALFLADTQLITQLPSGRDDFALFQAQRSAALQEEPTTEALAEKGTEITVAEENSWGSLISNDSPTEDAKAEEAVYVRTEIDNTTSYAVVRREDQRAALFQDIIVLLSTKRALRDVLLSKGFDEQNATRISHAAEQQINIKAPLEAGSIVALRVRQSLGIQQLLQMSLYSPDGYLASLAQIGAGRFAPSADPWFDQDLLHHSSQARKNTVQAKDVRLLDALYSAAIRNGLATDLVGEMIVLMSQRFDLDRYVAEGDHVTFLYATDPGPEGGGVGQLLYVQISGPSGNMRCYVTPDENSLSGFGCFDFDAKISGAETLQSLGGGMIVPVSGVKTSGFGPRHHPILKQIRNHTGVDWAAPIGTPVFAAKAGKVKSAGVNGAYGNVISIDHGDGIETRYAHLNGFAKGVGKGTQVKTGDLIGYVGTTGRSTGPHLHFEVRLKGEPINPLSFTGYSDGGATGSAAVEKLVNRIIRVESAGNAHAQNPNSTATGLGQFINSTWLRMMRDYRPDLAKRMSPQKLLELRFDPELSREMVRNLARENERYLRARGHQVTPGRLYLAHFLGPAGADQALNTPPNTPVLTAMGPSVVRANKFLRNMRIADLLAWADRKMRGASGQIPVTNQTTVATERPAPVPPDIAAYRQEIDGIISAL